MIWVNSVNNLENKIAKNIQESYSQWDYIRCYNLMKLMYKINKKNPTFLKYVVKLDEKKILNHQKRWALWGSSYLLELLKSPKLYITFISLYLLWRLK